MSGAVEWGKCEICGKETALDRTYFNYGIKCECHSPNHFELVRHCSNCVAKEPTWTNIKIKTSDLKGHSNNIISFPNGDMMYGRTNNPIE